MWNDWFARLEHVPPPRGDAIDAVAPGYRPRLVGRPFGLGRPVILPKPMALIRMRPARRWNVIERRLINVLLAATWGWLARPDFTTVMSVPTVVLRSLLGRADNDNRLVRAAVERLLSDDVYVDTTPGFGGPRTLAPTMGRILETGTIENRRLHWRFTPEVAALCRMPPVWARVDLEVIRTLDRATEIVLYEMMALGLGLSAPSWCIPLEDLRADLGVPNGSWTDFRRRTLENGLGRIARATGRINLCASRDRARPQPSRARVVHAGARARRIMKGRDRSRRARASGRTRARAAGCAR